MNDKRESTQQTREAAAIRRRWITLGEVLAVLAVLISGLTLWNSYSERSATEAARDEEKQEQKKVSRTLLLQASGSGKRITLAPHDSGQVIQSQTITFPGALGVDAVETVIEPRIEAGWIRPAARKARPAAPEISGDARLPLLITTRFVSGGETVTDNAIYDVGYKYEEGGLLGSDEVQLRGLSLVERVASGGKARLDALWKARAPTPAEAKD